MFLRIALLILCIAVIIIWNKLTGGTMLFCYKICRRLLPEKSSLTPVDEPTSFEQARELLRSPLQREFWEYVNGSVLLAFCIIMLTDALAVLVLIVCIKTFLFLLLYGGSDHHWGTVLIIWGVFMAVQGAMWWTKNVHSMQKTIRQYRRDPSYMYHDPANWRLSFAKWYADDDLRIDLIRPDTDRWRLSFAKWYADFVNFDRSQNGMFRRRTLAVGIGIPALLLGFILICPPFAPAAMAMLALYAALICLLLSPGILPKSADRGTYKGFVFSLIAERRARIDGYSRCMPARLNVPLTLEEACVVEIGERAFQGRKRLRRIDLPDGLERIGAEAFLNCRKLRRVNIPHCIQTLDLSAFQGCPNLVLTIPPTVETVTCSGAPEAGAFAGARFRVVRGSAAEAFLRERLQLMDLQIESRDPVFFAER